MSRASSLAFAVSGGRHAQGTAPLLFALTVDVGYLVTGAGVVMVGKASLYRQ